MGLHPLVDVIQLGMHVHQPLLRWFPLKIHSHIYEGSKKKNLSKFGDKKKEKNKEKNKKRGKKQKTTAKENLGECRNIHFNETPVPMSSVSSRCHGWLTQNLRFAHKETTTIKGAYHPVVPKLGGRGPSSRSRTGRKQSLRCDCSDRPISSNLELPMHPSELCTLKMNSRITNACMHPAVGAYLWNAHRHQAADISLLLLCMRVVLPDNVFCPWCVKLWSTVAC